jgi:uncharacterized protein (DUF1330 family)
MEMARVDDLKPEWLEYSLLRYSELPVVPVSYEDDNKVPLKGWEWGRWKDGGQGEEDRRKAIDLFEKGKCDGLAIVCGTPVHIDGERLYFFAIDIDLPAEEAARTLGRAGITTRFERTLRGRLHTYFFSRTPTPHLPDMLDPKTGEKVLEFKGYGKLVVVYPSRGYKKLNDSPPKIVDDALEVYGEICRALGYDLEDVSSEESGETVTDHSILSERLAAIIEELRRRGLNPRKGPNYYSCLCPFHDEKHPSFAINHKKFYAVDYHDGQVYRLLDLAKKLGLEFVVEVGEDSSAEKERRRSILSLVIPSGPTVLEAVGVQNGLGDYDPKLLVYGPDGFAVVENYRVGNDVITARPPRSYPYKPYVVESLEAKTRPELIDLIHREVERFIDAEPEEKATFTAFILLSYVQEFFDALPYLYLVGDNESGKSHLLNLMAELCYRPLAGVSHTAADLYSYLEDDGLPLTIIEDEYQGSEKDTEKMKVYKSGYKKGARVARVVTYEGGRRVDYFNSYGLKIVAAEKLIENKGFIQRCIVIEMVEGYPEKDHYDAEDYSRFARLRSELLKWRMRVLAGHESLPKVEADWLRGRDRELYLPLLTMLHGSPIYHALERFLRGRAEERRREREGSLEAAICRAVANLLADGSGEIDFSELWLEVKNEVGGVEELDRNNVARSMYSDLHGTISKRDIASILSAKLGMKKRRTTKNGLTRTIYIPDWGKLARALRKYGVNALMPKMPNPSEAPILENPSKTTPEAEKTPLPSETPQQ